jgi:predicted NBD/HSP70 family sugar kinase
MVLCGCGPLPPPAAATASLHIRDDRKPSELSPVFGMPAIQSRTMTNATIGIDIGGTKLLMIAHPDDGSEPIVVREPTGPAATPATIETSIRAFLTDNALSPTAVGIAVPGLVTDGYVTDCDVIPALSGWRGPTLDTPHVLIHDIRSALAYEARDLPPTATAVTVLCGTAVGSACLHRGTVLRGARGWAGELGYLPVTTATGSRRLDEVAGGSWLVEKTNRRPAEIHAALEAGDPAVTAAVTAAGEAFGLGLAAVVNLYNPDTVRVAGGTVGYRGYWDAALVAARKHSIPAFWDVCSVELIKEPEFVVPRGALRVAAAAARGEEWVREYT